MGRNGQPSDVKRIRNHIDNHGDPYITHAGADHLLVCSNCQSVFFEQRWYLKDQMDAKKLSSHQHSETVCPACRKTRDNAPGGVVQLSGTFLGSHQSDIANLISNEAQKATSINPLERIMRIDVSDGVYQVLTTNEKLAQRIGRALHKAYDGVVDYQWSEDNKLARVFWRRD